MVSRHAQRRRAHNAELIKKMRRGENLEAYDAESTWYPLRPIIKKDKAAIRMLTSKKVSND